MMASNNNDVSLGNILEQFPEFVMLLLPYIADRTVFNAIASCNRDINEKSKALVPPWPNHYRLPASHKYSIAVWSPDGTRVAYTCTHETEEIIAIVDQRHGIMHRTGNNECSWHFCDLKFSPDGRFLVSAERDNGMVKLWDNDIVGNYEQLQRWNIGEDDVGHLLRIDISACSKYIVVAPLWRNRVVLISIENGETIRSLTPQPVMDIIFKVIFSADCCAVFICGQCGNSRVVMLWRPDLEDTDENRLITLWEQEHHLNYNTKIIVSHDTTMIAIQDPGWNNGRLLSIDNNYSCTVQQLNFEGEDVPLLIQFTPDDEYIIYATEKELKYWSVAEKKFINNDCLFYNKKTMHRLKVMNCSPNTRQLIVRAIDKEGDESSSLLVVSELWRSSVRHKNICYRYYCCPNE